MSRSNLRLRPARPDDIRAMIGADIDPEYCAMAPVGYTAERDGEIVAVATITWDKNGVAWGWLNRIGYVPAITMHRSALRMLRDLREVGEPALYVICNLAVPGAEKWLLRLGFARDETLSHPWGPIYKCDLSN